MWSARVARADRVRIGAGIEQERGQFVVRVPDRQDAARWCRGRAPCCRRAPRLALDAVVHVRAGLQQGLGRRSMRPSRDREQQRREAGVEARAKIGAGLRSAPRTTSTLPSAAAHIRAVCPRLALLGVHVGAVREQQLRRRRPCRCARRSSAPSRRRAAWCSGRRRPSAAARPSPRCRWCRPARAASRRSGSRP